MENYLQNNYPSKELLDYVDLKKDLKDKDFKIIEKKLNYHIYDCFDLNDLQIPYEKRLCIINSTVKGKHIVAVKTKKINLQTEIKKNHDLYIKDCYEGLMIRNY